MSSHALKVLFIDNFDSFTFNIVDCLERLGAEVIISDSQKEGITHLLLGPGPGSPSLRDISLLHHYAGKIPIAGICLGHQTIGAAFGASIVRAKEPKHGKVEPIIHDGKGFFAGLSSPMTVTRYHSLVIDEATLPSDLIVTARSSEGEIMGVRHTKYLIEGVQFHPESIASEHSHRLFANFVSSKS